MSTWFKDTNIDLAELASVYRTPEQGVSAKSNSNIAFNDYRRMTPQANGANNSITTAGSQTLRFDDLADTGGVVGASNTYTVGATKGASSFTLVGSFTSTGSSFARSDDTSSAQGHFRLGAQSGTADLRGVATPLRSAVPDCAPNLKCPCAELVSSDLAKDDPVEVKEPTRVKLDAPLVAPTV